MKARGSGAWHVLFSAWCTVSGALCAQAAVTTVAANTTITVTDANVADKLLN